ncbi:MAG: hypothetical protein LAT53_12300, partial [Idiomarina sp.]|nr:hypothetical protein [Idiomarina sp.]
MQFREFEILAFRSPEHVPPYCDIFHRGERVVRGFRQADVAQGMVFSADGPRGYEEADLDILVTFAGYYIEREIPRAYLEVFAVSEFCNPDYFLGLYNTAIAASALYILSTNKHVFDPDPEIDRPVVDMEYLLDRLVRLLDEGMLHNLPRDVIAEFVRELDLAAFPLIPEHRAVIDRIAARDELRPSVPTKRLTFPTSGPS